MLESARVDKICHDLLEEILVSLHFVRKRADIRGNLGDIPRVLARFLVPPRFDIKNFDIKPENSVCVI